jgi:hypothetical protein
VPADQKVNGVIVFFRNTLKFTMEAAGSASSTVNYSLALIFLEYQQVDHQH